MFTIADAKAWAAERAQELDEKRLGHEDSFVRMMNRRMPDKSKGLWDSGCWLAEKLREHGATDQQVSSIQLACGQRAFMGDEWQAAVDYANEFAASGDTAEKGGAALAEKLYREANGE